MSFTPWPRALDPPGRCPVCGYALDTIRQHAPGCYMGPNASYTATLDGIRGNTQHPNERKARP